jgi:hypothetical protein
MSSFMVCNLSPNRLIRVIKSRRISWPRHVARKKKIKLIKDFNRETGKEEILKA